MRTFFVRLLSGSAVAICALQFATSRSLAVDTMADWVGLNNTTGLNNYSVISDTSAGGQFESRVNFVNDPTQSAMYYLGDPTLSTPLDYSQELHMSGTVTFNTPTNNNHNWFFGWYASTDTRHRIGLGVQGTTPAENDKMRFDFGYAGTFTPTGNFFSSVTSDGSNPNPPNPPPPPATITPDFITTIPNGTYPFTFDYVPGPEGVMKATVGNWFRDEGPQAKTLTDLTPFDSFGFAQRTTGIDDPNVSFNLVISNLTYTGGSAIGDANGDRIVNIFDINLVSAHWDEVGPEGDVNGDFAVNIFDINLISAYWTPTPPGASAAVPEPSSVVLACFGLVGMGALAWRRRRAVAR